MTHIVSITNMQCQHDLIIFNEVLYINQYYIHNVFQYTDLIPIS